MKKTMVTCDCCCKDMSPAQTREIGLVVRFGLCPPSDRTFDFCEDCLAKVAGHGVDDNRCSKSIIHQCKQAVLALFEAEVKKFDDAAGQEGGGS